jgi:hypothetical protein
MNEQSEYNQLVGRQQGLLRNREALVAGLHKVEDKKALEHINQSFFNRLKSLSPGNLRPVLVRRPYSAQDDSFAAYLIMSTGNNGARLLLCSEPWRIIWVRRSAQVKQIKTTEGIKLHTNLVAIQERKEQCLTALKKACRMRKSRKQTARNT